METRKRRRGHMRRFNQMMQTFPPRAPQPKPHRFNHKYRPIMTLQHNQNGNVVIVLYLIYLFLCVHIKRATFPSFNPLLLFLSLPPLCQTAELIRALQELENAASGDSVLRQRISSLPAEVQDTSLLQRITGRQRKKF